jgi:hypothetical protein
MAFAGATPNPAAYSANGFISRASTIAATAVPMQIYKPSGLINVPPNYAMYIYTIQCLNTAAAATVVTLQDGANVVTYVPCPVGAAVLPLFPEPYNPPLRISLGVTPTLTPAAATTTLYLFMSGYLDLR